MDYSTDQMDGQTAVISIGADIAFSKGMLVVASAGNEANDPDWRIITAPADGVNAAGYDPLSCSPE